MFGISIYKIIGILVAVGLLVGYYMHTQSKLEELNQTVAIKEFALKSAETTIAKTQEDLKKQAEIASKINDSYQEARREVDTMRDKFNRDGKDLDQRAAEDSSDLERRVNRATKRALDCIENVINKETGNGC
jgi:uncharacterized protein HemX